MGSEGVFLVISKIKSGLEWRFRKYLSPVIDLYGSPFLYIIHKIKNYKYFYTSNIIYIYANRRNIGDYISFLGIRKEMQVPGVELYCAPLGSKELRKYLLRAKNSSRKYYVIVGGGGLFQEVFSYFWEFLVETNLTFYIFGVGTNRLKERKGISPDLMRKIIVQAQSVVVRDSMTQKEIQEIVGDELPIGVCPAVNFLYPKFCEQNSPKFLLHVIHPSDIRMAGGDLSKLRACLKETARSLNLEYKEHNNMGCNYQKILRMYTDSKVVISSRLHGCIISYALGVPFVPISCDDKIQAFLDSHTLNKRAIEIQKMYDLTTTVSIVKAEINSSKNNETFLQEKILTNRHFAEKISSTVKGTFDA